MQKTKDDDVRSIWTYNQRDLSSAGTSFSDKDFVMSESNSDLINLSIDFPDCHGDSASRKRASTQAKLQKLQISKLDSISIPSTAANQHIVHLKQSFNFATSFKPSKDSTTQTVELDLMQTRHQTIDESPSQRSIKRPSSLPPENIALSNLEKRVQADVEPKFLTRIGDGVSLTLNAVGGSKDEINKQPDLEIAGCMDSPMPVQCVLIKPK